MSKEAKIIFSNNQLAAELPMTQPTGKIRIKQRSHFAEYGIPIAVKSHKMSQDCYAEWQIGYDLLKNDENATKTTLTDWTFINYKGEKKYPYELCEILYYAHKVGLLNDNDIMSAYNAISSINETDTFEQREDMNICRTHPKDAHINGMDFYKMTVSYPLLVHQFGEYNIYSEIVIKEKQRAVGTQAMLYLCIPLTKLTIMTNIIGRTMNTNETAVWQIGAEEAKLALELFHIFGMLSPKHRYDVLEIFKTIFDFIR